MTEDRVRLFVGVSANHEDAESQAVLEHSARSSCSLPLDIVWMRQSRDVCSPWYSGPGGWDTSRWATPFSGFRWAIPAACGYEGRAIYSDSDVIFRGDLAELWRAPMRPGVAVMAKGKGSWRFCVSLWDCAEAKAHVFPLQHLRADASSHRDMGLRFRAAPFVQSFPDGQNWNCLDGEDLPLDHPSTKAIHYTAMANQPHLPLALARLRRAGGKHWFDGRVEPHWRHDLIVLFADELRAAEAAGYTVESYCTDPPFGEYRKASLKNYRPGPRPH